MRSRSHCPPPCRFVNVLRPIKSLFGGHGWRSGNAAFDKSFWVHAVPRVTDATVALLSPLVPSIAARADWTFAFGGPRLVCVTHDPFGSTAELTRTLDQVVALVTLISPQTGGQIGQTMPAMPAMPAMPDGTPFDPDTVEQQLATMTPEQQAAYIVRMAGHRGLDEAQIAEAIRQERGSD